MTDPESNMRYLDPIVAGYAKSLKPSNQLALDVGCGVAAYRSVLGSENYVGVDVTNDDYDNSSRRNPNILSTAMNLPFLDGSFGLVFFVNVCMYLNPTELRVALTQANRVLGENGRLLIADYSLKILKAESDARKAQPYLKFCRDWIDAATESGFSRIKLIIKPYRPLVSFVNLTPTYIRYYLIDRYPCPILLTARKGMRS